MSLQDSKVLLVTARKWHSCARIAIALRDAGFRIDVVCPAKHSILATSVVSRAWMYRPFKSLVCIANAIASSSPDLIVPCDDIAVAVLHRLAQTTDDRRVQDLIESSIGSARSYEICASRVAIQRLAVELNLPVPRASMIESEQSLEEAIAAVGLPGYLKTDGSSGGTGVGLVETVEQGRGVYRRLASSPSMLRAIKRATVDRDRSMLPSALEGKRPQISLQQAIPGPEANSTIFCWRGEVMASITAEVVMASMKHGPSTVLRRIDNSPIDDTTAAIAKALNLSGMYGFDFVLQEGTGRPMLIEMNARPTQTSHLALGDGRDLAAAAFAAVTQSSVKVRPVATRRKLIALFPGELLRDPTSEYLEQGYHDLPVSEPKLVRICERRPSKLKRLLTVQGWKRARKSVREKTGRAPKDQREGSTRFSAEAHPSQIK